MATRTRQLLKEADRSQGWLADKLGADRSAVTRLLAENRPIDLELAERLGAAFGLAPWGFLGAGADPVWPFIGGKALDVEAVRQEFLAYVKDEMIATRGKLAKHITQELLGRLVDNVDGLMVLTNNLIRLRMRLKEAAGEHSIGPSLTTGEPYDLATAEAEQAWEAAVEAFNAKFEWAEEPEGDST